MAAANQQFLPLEIVEEILIHLPVKSLASFRCVSKSWRSLITQPRFVRKHLNVSQQKTLIIGNEGNGDRVEFCRFPLSTQGQPGEKTLLRCPLRGDFSYYWLLVASCDGLLCLWIGDSVFLWNPCLNNAHRRVFPPPTAADFLKYSCVYFDLGYDSTVDDYKLLMISSGMGSSLTFETHVFSMRSESWTKLEDYPDDYAFPEMSVFVNGSFHWVGKPIPTLLSFDLSDGKYGEVVPLPEYDDDEYDDDHGYVYVKPCVLKGMLGVVVKWSKSSRLVLWVMKDYCQIREWTKILDITLADDVGIRRMDVRPFYMDENGEVKMGLFSRAWGLWRAVIENKRSGCFVHVESLVSPVNAGAIISPEHRVVESHKEEKDEEDDDTDDEEDDDDTDDEEDDDDIDDEFILLTQDKYVHNL